MRTDPGPTTVEQIVADYLRAHGAELHCQQFDCHCGPDAVAPCGSPKKTCYVVELVEGPEWEEIDKMLKKGKR